MTQPRVVFVFGSNRSGQHIAGAARDAVRFWGAQQGVGEGPTGEAYAIPTMPDLGWSRRKSLALDEIARSVATFLIYAATFTDETFYVTKIGCGIAGYTEAEIAPLFAGAPANVQLPHGWRTAA